MTFEEDLEYAKKIDRVRLAFINFELEKYFTYGKGQYHDRDGIIVKFEYFDDNDANMKVFNTDTDNCDYDVSSRYNFICYEKNVQEFEVNEVDSIKRRIFNFDLIPKDFSPEMHFQYSLIYDDNLLSAITVFWYLRYVVQADTFFLKFDYVDRCLELLGEK